MSGVAVRTLPPNRHTRKLRTESVGSLGNGSGSSILARHTTAKWQRPHNSLTILDSEESHRHLVSFHHTRWRVVSLYFVSIYILK